MHQNLEKNLILLALLCCFRIIYKAKSCAWSKSAIQSSRGENALSPKTCKSFVPQALANVRYGVF